MNIMNFGNKSFVAVKGLKERIQEAEKENQMREIKFRAWDKVAKKFLHPWPDGFHIFGETTCFDMIGMQLKERNPEKTTLEMLNDVIIEQFTGLKDKNGKEIYDGDIIESYSEMVNIGDGRKTGRWKRTCYTIEWKSPMFTKRRHENNYLDGFGIGSQEHIAKYYEVIGNIHQPEEQDIDPANPR